ncbi:MAG TPA: bifunctional 2',3'-cyclic-nucleotide 2'-phosphodiesterase/3'-nucleotidase [Paenirhodobacter sp.]
MNSYSTPARAYPDMTAARLSLRIMATTDLHGFLRGFDYSADRPRGDSGLSRIASLIARARQETCNTLLFDNGDLLQGSHLADFWGQQRGIGPGEVHPLVAAMNALGYDAAAPGNHDFDFGLPFLSRVIADAHFPYVCANAFETFDTGLRGNFLRPWAILTRQVQDTNGAAHVLRIGVIGFVPAQTADWEAAQLGKQLTTEDIIATARTQVPALRAAGADLVIALAHTGIATGNAPHDADDNVAIPLAAIEGIDVLVCGHSHQQFPHPDYASRPGVDAVNGRLHGKPTVLPGHLGSHLGVIDLSLRKTPGGRWTIERSHSTLRPVTSASCPGTGKITELTPEQDQIVQLSERAHAEVRAELAKNVGRTSVPLQSFFSLIAPDAAMSVVAEAKAEFIARAVAQTPQADLPILAAVRPARFGGHAGPSSFVDIGSGPLQLRDVLGLYAYPNLVSAICLNGAQIIEWLERSASVYRTIQPGDIDQPLLDQDFPSYNFDALYGLTYEIDLSAPPRYTPNGTLCHPDSHRIRDLRHDGRLLQDTDRFLVASDSHRAASFSCLYGAQVLHFPNSARNMLIDAIRRKGTIAPQLWPVWRFTPIPGARAWFDTAPAARTRQTDLARLHMVAGGITPAGYLRISLDLSAPILASFAPLRMFRQGFGPRH